MFGFIKKIIAGILGFIAGLLPGKNKNGEYYLQLDENEAEPTPAKSDDTKATAIASQAEEKPAPATTKAAKVKASKNTKAAPTEAVEKAPAAVATKQEPAEIAFATKYLIPSSSNGRRRPGANMSSFLDMASQIKTPSKAS